MLRRILGSGSEGAYEFIEFLGDQLPFEIGSLERRALSCLGEWNRCKMKDAPFGFYYRMGIKEKVIDADGDPATVFLYFVAPFTKEGHAMTPQKEATLDQMLTQLTQISAIAFSQYVGNSIVARVLPPDYMLEELFALLPK